MSTPSREEMQSKYAEGKALDLFAGWCDNALETFETILAILPEAGTDFEAGQVCLLRDMLRPIRKNARELSVLKLNVARSMASERLADAELESVEARRHNTITEEERQLFEDAYLAGRKVNAYDQAETRKTLEHEKATEELTQDMPLERKLAGRERLYLVETEPDKHDRLEVTPPMSTLDPLEVSRAMEDATLFGTGYIVDGKRVAPQVVRVMIRRPSDGTVEELETV